MTVALAVLFFLSLVDLGASAFLLVRTLQARSVTPTALLNEWSEMQAEWASTLEMLSRHEKRRAKRAKDDLIPAQAVPVTGDKAAVKQQLRDIARQRGLM